MIAWLQRTVRFVLIWFKPKSQPQPPLQPAPILINPAATVASPPTDPLIGKPVVEIAGSFGVDAMRVPEQKTTPTQSTNEPHPQGNRTMRRRISALERARRKHDKFVTPQGTPPTPKHIERPPKIEDEPKPPTIAVPEAPTGEMFLVDKHHTGGGEDVLYRESELYGEYNFRDTILEQLDRYFVYLKRMKTKAPDAYELYKEVGSILLPYVDIHPDMATGRKQRKYRPEVEMPKLSPWFKKNRPGFGCFVYGANPLAEKNELEESEKALLKKEKHWLTVPKFMYFSKYDQPPPEVQPMSGGDIYLMSIWWDHPHDPTFKRKHGGPTEYAVFISADGERMEILRMCKTSFVQVPTKKHKKDSNGNIHFHFDIPQRNWRIPKIFEDWAADFHEDVQVHLGRMFSDAMLRYEYSQYAMIRIAAKKDDMTAIFSVNVRRMAYFFKDRDYVLTEYGTRKPVFHMVRAHERETATGKHAVKFHFRGEREFTWAGYQIKITVPGRDHFMLPEFDIGFVDEHWIDKDDDDSITVPEMAKKISGWIDSGLGGVKPK